MLFSLVKKDFILAKKYILFLGIFAVGIPILYTLQVSQYEGTLVFLLTVLMLEYMMFNTVWVQEEKYKGSVLLCTTPYTRKTLVKEKYIFILTIFILSYIIYTATSVVVPIGIKRLSLNAIGTSFLISTIFFGVLIPALYKFGFQKTRYIGILIILAVNFMSSKIAQLFEQLNFNNIKFMIPFPEIIINLIPYIIAVTIGLISMSISIDIYSKKDL